MIADVLEDVIGGILAYPYDGTLDVEGGGKGRYRQINPTGQTGSITKAVWETAPTYYYRGSPNWGIR